jgi:hypothetical protein
MKERRLGRFRVSEKLLRKAIDSGHGANLFIGCVPLDVKCDWITGQTEFIVWHPSFDVISDGEITPEYEATFLEGSVTPKWSRKGGAA